ncbi:MAG TPA: alpha/beta hydrolase, partial [Ktedonobacterales bacterium]|nr:alpha/beta hydrolase [Ktedonobacterales bacterium]
MQNLRLYGQPPFTVAVLHGGPGAPGTMAPVARELATEWGVLEPLQTADSLDGQVEELRAVLDEHADLPVTLIGSSWGAMLGYIFAARYPAHVRKLILVGSGVYEARYAAGIEQTRLDRLSEAERARALELLELLELLER